MKFTDKEKYFIDDTENRLKKINKFMPVLLGLLSVVFVFYSIMLYNSAVTEHTLQIMMKVGYTSLWVNRMFFYPSFFVKFWRLLIITGFLGLIIIIFISFWHEIRRHSKAIIKLNKIKNKDDSLGYKK